MAATDGLEMKDSKLTTNTSDDLEDSGDHSKDVTSQSSEVISKLKNDGTAAGFKGKDLSTFISNGLAAHYEWERQKELKLMEVGQEAAKIKLKQEENQNEAARIRLIQEENDIRRAELAQKERLHTESLKAKHQDKIAATKPKLPYFEDKSDDIESYLFRFEKHAQSLKWPQSDWSTALSVKTRIHLKHFMYKNSKLYIRLHHKWSQASINA